MPQKNQHILVIIQDFDLLPKVVKHAFTLAKLFACKLAFTHLSLKKENNSNRLRSELFASTTEGSSLFEVVELHDLHKEPAYSIQQLDVLLLLVQVSEISIQKRYKKNIVLNLMSRARIPSIVIGSKTILNCDYQNIIVPVTYRKESKEKMIWASYFGRFNRAVIHLLVPNDKLPASKRNVKAILLFTKKMFEQFTFNYQITKSDSDSRTIYQSAFNFSKAFNSDLVVLMSSPNPGWIDSYFGSGELKSFLRKEENPILYINPSKDYYLPCN